MNTCRTSTRRALLGCALCVILQGCGGGTAAVGSACTEKEQCGGGLCLQAERYDAATGWTDGYCSAECDLDCDDLSTCVDLGGSAGQRHCVTSCEEDSECRPDYVCNPWWMACLPHCATDGFDCGDALECGADGHCIDPEGGVVGGGVVEGDPTDGLAGMNEPCAGPASCVAGYICNPWARLCLGDCRPDGAAPCPAPEVCAPEGFCHLPPRLPPPDQPEGGDGPPHQPPP